MPMGYSPEQGTPVVAKKKPVKKRAKRIKKIVCKKLAYIKDYDARGDLEAGWYVVDKNQTEEYELIGPYEVRDDAMEIKAGLIKFWREENSD